MAFNPRYGAFTGVAATDAALDQGLRDYMLRVYNWMASGLVLTGLTAYAVVNTALFSLFYQQGLTRGGGLAWHPTGLAFVAMLAPFAFILVLQFGVNRLSRPAAQALYWGFCIAMGVSLSNVFLVYTQASVVRLFFATAAGFAGLSLYGYTTGRNLTGMAGFLFMGLIGLVTASLLNMFIASSPLQLAISAVGVLVFAGLTAYDTQRIKSDYLNQAYASGPDAAAKRSVYDALSLYLNFVNLFMMALNLFGSRNSD